MVEQVYNRSEQIKEANVSTRYQPGESGNPAGRPKNSVTTLLKNKSPEENQAVADKLYALALEGDMSAIREYIDRTDGKQLEAPQDNRPFIIVVSDRAAEAIAKLDGRTKMLTEGEDVV